MKYFIILLLAALPLISNAQTTTPSGQPTAGDYLIKASTRYYTSVALMTAGGIIMTLGAYNGYDDIFYTGAVGMGVGAAIGLTTWCMIGKAGNALNNQSRVSTNTKYGVGLALRL